MKVEVLRENLKNGLSVVEKIIGKQISLPILDNVLISAEDNFLQLISTDLETAVKIWMLAKIIKKGKVTVPVKILSSFTSLLPNEKVTLEEQSQRLEVQCGTFKNKIQATNAEEFPLIPEFGNTMVLEADSQKLCQAISQVIDILPPSQGRSEISGMYMEVSKGLITLAATDSFRLAEKKIYGDHGMQTDISFILPQKPAKEIVNILQTREGKVKMYISPNQVMVEYPMKEIEHAEVQIISRLIDGEYPQYEEIIPRTFKSTVTLRRDEFLNQIKAASLFSGKINEVKILTRQKEQIVQVISKDVDVGENQSEMSAQVEGEDMEISFNYKFLLDGLSHIRSSEIVFQLSKEDGPCMMKPVGDDSYLYVVMPIKA